MKSDRIFDAIGKADDRYIVSAQSRMDKTRETGRTDEKGGIVRMDGTDGIKAIEKTVKKKRMIRNHAFRKLLYSAAAIVILLVSFFSVAMAVNADFRNAVFRFFHISTADVVLPKEEEPEQPSSLGDIKYVGSKDIEDMAKVEYVQVNGNVVWSGGVIWVASYEEETAGQILGVYALEKGQLTSLEPHPEKLEYVWDDETYEISFEWYENNGKTCVNARQSDMDSDQEWSVQAVDGKSDYVIIKLSRGAQIDYTSRPLLYNLRTKEVVDVIEGCDILNSQLINEIKFSPGLSKVLFSCDLDSVYYYYDVAAKALKSLNELAGMEVWGAWFVDDETIGCTFENEDGTYTCKAFTISSGKFLPIYAGLTRKKWNTDSGVMFTGGRYGLFVDEEHNTFVYDCKTGERAVVKGFKYPSGNDGAILNKAGNKILLDMTDSSAPGLGVSQIGVLDLEKRSFTLLDREGYEVRYEGSMSWFDNDRIVIQAHKDSRPSVGIQYLYIYTIK